MASTPTQRNRLEKQGLAEHVDTWGVDHLNVTLELIDDALDGIVELASEATPYTLSDEDYAEDEARKRILHVTGPGALRVIAPAVEKWYLIVNELVGVLQFTVGASTITIPKGLHIVVTDGTTVWTQVNDRKEVVVAASIAGSGPPQDVAFYGQTQAFQVVVYDGTTYPIYYTPSPFSAFDLSPAGSWVVLVAGSRGGKVLLENGGREYSLPAYGSIKILSRGTAGSSIVVSASPGVVEL